MSRRAWGYLLISISLFGLLIMYFQVRRSLFADFPCSYTYQGGRPADNSDSVISYCISFIRRDVRSGGGIYSEGESKAKTVSISNRFSSYKPIGIERVDTGINVNGTLLRIGESHSWIEYYPTINPWVIYNAKMMITNKGNINDSKAVYIEGEIREGWLPNPLGIILLLLGIYSVKKKVPAT